MADLVIVDDDAAVRRLFRDVLEGAGYGVFEAASAKEALRIVRARSIDLVITDILMPDMDGLELTRQLHREFPAVKIIAMSGGQQDIDYCGVARLLGAHEALLKPVAVQRLLDTVAGLLPTPADGPPSA